MPRSATDKMTKTGKKVTGKAQAAAPAQKLTRGRKAKGEQEKALPAAPVPIPSGESYSTHEQLLRERYPVVSIRPNSWRPAGERADHGHKCTVVTVCPCGNETVRATSDLWQCGSHCPLCRKQVIKNQRDKKKEAKKL